MLSSSKLVSAQSANAQSIQAKDVKEAVAPSPYEAIVEGAQTRKGLFTVHQRKDKFYFEIPKAMLGRDMLWHVEAATVPALPEYSMEGGTGTELASTLIRWAQRDDMVYVNGYDAVAQRRSSTDDPPLPNPADSGTRTPTRTSLDRSGEPTTYFAFPIAAQSPSGSLVIDVSGTFLADSPDLGSISKGALDARRSYVTYLKTFPRNVEASVHLTYINPGAKSTSFEIHHSITLLPDKPMMPRLFDDRVGFFNLTFEDYSDQDEVGVETKAFITRYRLEKKNPNAALSEPVKPIVYYLARDVPYKWRPYFRQAVESWNVAFEAAGFKNAIVAKDAPSEEQDPDWDPADTRYSIIRWISTPVANGMGPNIHDPRTGEILSAHILIWADVVRLAQQWYYTMAAGTDLRARTLPMPDSVVGPLMRYVVAHEVGHTLGLRHNHRASTAYTVKQLRDKEFAAKYGSVASIMAYGRFNYVAQPEDSLSPESLLPRIAPYDIHAISWGYKPIPTARKVQDEEPVLDEWAAKAVTNPWLAWGGEDIRDLPDPRVLTQNVGAERIEATQLGLKNLERALEYLPQASTKRGRGFKTEAEFYTAIMDAWLDQTSSVVKEIGGLEEDRTLAGRGPQYRRVSGARQKAALDFLLTNALRRPDAFMPARLYADIQPYGLSDIVLERQSKLLEQMLKPMLAGVMQDSALFKDADRYSYTEYLATLTNGLFEELDQPNPKVDPLRRSLQRRYLVMLAGQMATPPIDAKVRQAVVQNLAPGYYVTVSDTYVSDYRAAGLAALQNLAERLKQAEGITTERETLEHIREARRLTQRALVAGETPAPATP